jgi:glycine/D-amino acid oxidase-like deaminating enzyme
LFEPRAFHFHPLKYAHGRADAAMGQGAACTSIRRRSRSNGSAGAGACAPEGEVGARTGVLACGGYLARLVGASMRAGCRSRPPPPFADGDVRWREFADYGLVSASKPAGFLGAELSYWWAEAKDAWKDRRERLMQA